MIGCNAADGLGPYSLLSVEVHRCFLQELIDVEGDGMADMVFRCIQEMDIDNRMMVLLFLNDNVFEVLLT